MVCIISYQRCILAVCMFLVSTDASLIAIEMMLQEDFSHTTARLLALHACSQYLHTSKDNLLSAHTEDDKPTLDDEEEDYIVSYLTLPYRVKI